MKWGFYLLVFFIPLALLFLTITTEMNIFVVLAFIIQYGGLIMERWYFFAEASHPQNLYYSSKG